MSTPSITTGAGAARVFQQCLPISAGDTVLLVGPAPGLDESLAVAGASVARWAPGSERSPDDADYDHVIVPDAGAVAGLDLREIGRRTRPGGGLVLAVAHRWHVPADRRAWSQRRGRAALRDAGFACIETYGAQPEVSNPRILVPLGDPAVFRWFLISRFFPNSAVGRVGTRAYRLAAASPAAAVAFPALVFVGRRRSSLEQP